MISCLGLLIAVTTPYTIETCWANKDEIILGGKISIHDSQYNYEGTFSGEIKFNDSCKVKSYKVYLNPPDFFLKMFIMAAKAEIEGKAETVCESITEQQ